VVLLALGSRWSSGSAPGNLQIIFCLSGFALLSVALGWLPFRLGLRALRRFEL
jgi:hypothetical protein